MLIVNREVTVTILDPYHQHYQSWQFEMCTRGRQDCQWIWLILFWIFEPFERCQKQMEGKHLTSFASVYQVLSSSRLPLSHQSNGRSLSTSSWYFMSRSLQHNQGIVNVGRMYALLAHGLLRLLFGLLAAWRKFDVRVGVILMLDCLMDIEFLLLCKCKTFSQRFT